jgi:sterol desaturase/sphingolipid hydroxylase (fatty acid hydroxylase superfamily)
VFQGSVEVIRGSASALLMAMQILLLSALGFALLALLVKGREAIAAAERARKEISINLSFYVLDVLFVAPLAALVVQLIRATIGGSPLEVLSPPFWQSLPIWVTALTVVFLGDFISYFRHRLEHTRLLWPSHAIHHSDAEMTWLTLSRFHPINRLTTMIVDTSFLAILGFPEWALLTNVLVRHYYGEFIHADLPWMYGPLGRVFVSPVMHRWHHARDVTGAGSNFATVFSVFDQAFGTYYVPGLCTVPLGVNDEMGKGTVGQLMYPFVAWGRRIARRYRRARGIKPAFAKDKVQLRAGR